MSRSSILGRDSGPRPSGYEEKVLIAEVTFRGTECSEIILQSDLRMGEMRNAHKICIGKTLRKEDLGVDGNITSEWILGK
jgi:hypothetical protein